MHEERVRWGVGGVCVWGGEDACVRDGCVGDDRVGGECVGEIIDQLMIYCRVLRKDIIAPKEPHKVIRWSSRVRYGR